MHEFSGHNIRGNQTCCQGKTAQTAADPDSRPPNNRNILTPKQTSVKTKPAAQKKNQPDTAVSTTTRQPPHLPNYTQLFLYFLINGAPDEHSQ